MRLINTLFLTGLWLIILTCASTSMAQTPLATNAAPAASSNLTKIHALIPQEAVACLSVRMQQIKLDQALRLLPWEIISAASLDELGIDLSAIDRFDLFVGPIAEPPGIAGVITGKSKLDLTKLNPQRFGRAQDGKSFSLLGERDLRNIKIVPLSDSQVLIGHVDTIGPFLNAQRGAGDLQKQLQRLGENGHISLVFVPESIRSLLVQGASSLPPEEASDMKVFAEKVQLVAARAQIDTNPTINVLIEAANEADAQAVETSWNRQVEINASQLMRGINRTIRANDLMDSRQAYSTRVMKEIRELLRPTRKGTRLLLTLDHRAISLARGLGTFANFGQIIGGSVPSSEPPRRAMRLDVNPDIDKLKKIGLAVHNYEAAYKMLPMGGDTNQQKQKQLSWRVTILPFLGEPELTQLYQQFKLDEPWNSETNAKLLEKMPEIYRYSKASTPPGHTVMHMPQGPGLISEAGKRVRFGNITDGLRNTILIALSKDEAAVPWTKPADFNPLENLELIRSDDGKMLFVIADGSISHEPSSTPEKLKALLTIAGE